MHCRINLLLGSESMRKRKEALAKEEGNNHLVKPVQIKRNETEKVRIFQGLDEEQ